MQTEWKDVSDTLLRSWRAKGYSVAAVAQLTKIPLDVLEERYYALNSTEEVPAPTPLEIRQRCEEIQREWSESERRRRCVYKTEWTPIAVPASVLTSVTSSADGYTAWSGLTRRFAT